MEQQAQYQHSFSGQSMSHNTTTPANVQYQQPMYQQPTVASYHYTPAYAPSPYENQPPMSQQIATLQQTILAQNQKQMEMVQIQFQKTLEQSLKTNSDTMMQTLAKTPTVNNPYPPEIQCGSPQPSDCQSAASSIPPMEKTTTSNHSSNTTNSKQEMLEFVTALREPKLTFNPLKTTTDFITWKAMMALKCSKSTKHSHLSQISDKGCYEFKTDLNAEDSSTLFMLIYDSLGSIADKIIVNVNVPNGINLLQQLEDFYVDIDTSVVN